MKLSWLDCFVIYWYGIKQPYDEHARAVVGRISTAALLLLVMVEFCLLLVETLLNLPWLNSVALIVLFAAIFWVATSIDDAGLMRIETTAYDYHQTLKRLKWDSTRNVIIYTILFSTLELLASSQPNYLPHTWAGKLLLALLGGLVAGVYTYFRDKNRIHIIPEND